MAYDPSWGDTTTSFGDDFGGPGFGQAAASGLGGAVKDIFDIGGSFMRAKGNRLEAKGYDRAAGFADLNAQFTETTTNIKTAQLQRQEFQQLGTLKADVAGAGFQASGSAMDLLRSTNQQAELEKAVAGQQGLITEQGYKVQAQNYRDMAKASRTAADAQELGGFGSAIGAGLKLAPLLLA
jgi:hypothetical protein